MMTARRACVAASFALASCGSGSSSEIPEDLRVDYNDVAAGNCASPAGGASDLRLEPNFTAELFRWRDSRGCAVRVDVIQNMFGDSDHCNKGALEIMQVGATLGEPISSGGRWFYWDPDNALHRVVGGTDEVSTSDLPETALDSGFRRGALELWTDPARPDRILRVDGTRVQVLQQDTSGLVFCA